MRGVMTPRLKGWGYLTKLSSGGFSAAAVSLFSVMNPQPTLARKRTINNLIVSLQSSGVWSSTDVLYVLAAHSSQAASLNWKNPATFTLATLNSPTFTTDRGYTGDGVSSGLTGGPNLSSFGGLYALDNASFGVWCGTDATENVGDWGATNNNIRSHAGATTMSTRANDGTSTTSTISPATAVGLSAWSRNNSSDYITYKNGVALATIAVASVAISNATTTICFVGGGFSTKRVQLAKAGAALTAAQHLAEYNAFNSYMTAIGAA